MFDITHIIEAGGLLLIGLIIFSESGMMVGFVFPGDTLLLSAGVLAASGKLSLFWTIVVVAVAAILGDNVGYQIGRSIGRRLFRKPDSLIFRHEYIMMAERFYEKHGSKTMLVAHFLAMVRTFAPVAAGAAHMPRAKFMIYDAIGDIAWAISLPLFGYFVGSRIPGIDRYIEPLLILVVLGVLAPTIYHIVRDPRIRAMLKQKFSRRSQE
jgi:membrane-associated protein